MASGGFFGGALGLDGFLGRGGFRFRFRGGFGFFHGEKTGGSRVHSARNRVMNKMSARPISELRTGNNAPHLAAGNFPGFGSRIRKLREIFHKVEQSAPASR